VRRTAHAVLIVVVVVGTVIVAATGAASSSAESSQDLSAGDDGERDFAAVARRPRSSRPLVGVDGAASFPSTPDDVSESAFPFTLGDPVGDVPIAQADITNSTFYAPATGTITLTTTVYEFSDPTGVDWQVGDTFAMWDLDVDGDGIEDFTAVFWNDDGVVVGEVLTADFVTKVCDATPSTSDVPPGITVPGRYMVAFPSLCIGDPSTLAYAAAMTYEITATGAKATDWAPDLTWSPDLVNEGSTPIRTLTPHRYYDSRWSDGPRQSGSVTAVQIGGVGGVPAGAKAAIVNVTAVDAREPGFMTVFPCDIAVPEGSNVNFRAGQTVPNLVFAPLASDGRLCVYTFGSAGLIVDVTGYLPQYTDIEPVPGIRIYDSRWGDGPLTDYTTIKFSPNEPTGVQSLILNVTAADALETGFMAVYPCSGSGLYYSPDNASNLNFVTGETRANAAVTKVDLVSEAFCVFARGSADLIIDLNGAVPASSRLFGVRPQRLLDSRTLGHGASPRPAGSITEVQVAGLPVGLGGPVPDGDARTAVLNVTVDQPQAWGYVTVFPCGEPLPESSNLNYVAGETVANAVVAKIGVGGKVCLYTYAATHLIVDVTAFAL
jgi:hypothetical protein